NAHLTRRSPQTVAVAAPPLRINRHVYTMRANLWAFTAAGAASFGRPHAFRDFVLPNPTGASIGADRDLPGRHWRLAGLASAAGGHSACRRSLGLARGRCPGA